MLTDKGQAPCSRHSESLVVTLITASDVFWLHLERGWPHPRVCYTGNTQRGSLTDVCVCYTYSSVFTGKDSYDRTFCYVCGNCAPESSRCWSKIPQHCSAHADLTPSRILLFYVKPEVFIQICLLLFRSVTLPRVPTKHEKCYDPHDPTLKFVDKEDDLDCKYHVSTFHGDVKQNLMEQQ